MLLICFYMQKKKTPWSVCCHLEASLITHIWRYTLSPFERSTLWKQFVPVIQHAAAVYKTRVYTSRTLYTPINCLLFSLTKNSMYPSESGCMETWNKLIAEYSWTSKRYRIQPIWKFTLTYWNKRHHYGDREKGSRYKDSLNEMWTSQLHVSPHTFSS